MQLLSDEVKGFLGNSSMIRRMFEAGIELKRNADTSSDTFYETIDTGVAYTIPDYAVCATIDSDDYDALITAPDTTEGEVSP